VPVSCHWNTSIFDRCRTEEKLARFLLRQSVYFYCSTIRCVIGNSSSQTSSISSNGGKKQAGGSGNVSARHVTSRGGKSESHRGGTAKTTRIRTVLNEKQLHTLRTCYAANPRPDALMKDQLVEMTGLSSRVIRVWFQNKRCKDKKRTILIKQLQQQHQDKVYSCVFPRVGLFVYITDLTRSQHIWQ